MVSRRRGFVATQGNLLLCKRFLVEPERGFEPRAYALRVRCSTPELPRRRRNGSAVHTTPCVDAHNRPAVADSLAECFLDEWDGPLVTDSSGPGEGIALLVGASGSAHCRHSRVGPSAEQKRDDLWWLS